MRSYPALYRPTRPGVDERLKRKLRWREQFVRYEIGISLGIALFLAFFFESADAPFVQALSWIAPVLLGATLTVGAYAFLNRDFSHIWSPMFWFRVATIVYFCFGGIVPSMLNDESSEYFRYYFAFTPNDEIKHTAIVAVCMACVLLGYVSTERVLKSVMQRQFTASRTSLAEVFRSDAALRMGILFAIVGVAVKWLVSAPAAFGWIEWVVPGMVTTVGLMTYPASFLLILNGLNARSPIVFLGLAITASDIAFGFLTFVKFEILMPVIVAFLAVVMQRPSPMRLASFGVVIFLFFSFVNPMVSYCRDEFNARAQFSKVTIETRFELILNYYTVVAPQEQESGFQGDLMRLSYVNMGTLAISYFDQGAPEDTLSLWWTQFIPRALWPEKPELLTGKNFAERVTGREAQQSISPGLFAESYLNLGWWGPIVLMIPFGVILSAVTALNSAVLRSGTWVFMPILFLSLRMGLRPDGSYVGDVVGTAVIITAFTVIIGFSRAILASANR